MKKIILFFGKIYFTIKGYFLIKKYDRNIGKIYFCRKNCKYYKYLGKNVFKEGNKRIDVGYSVFETEGNNIVFSYYLVGLLNLEPYNYYI